MKCHRGNVIDSWAEYFEELLNRPTTDETEIQFNNGICDVNKKNSEQPTVDEIKDSIAKLRKGRTFGEDLIRFPSVLEWFSVFYDLFYEI